MLESPPPLAPMSSDPMAEHRHGQDAENNTALPDDLLSASRVDRRNHRPPQDLGSALDSLNDSQSSHTSGASKTRRDHRASIEWGTPQEDSSGVATSLFLDEPMEEGLGVGHVEHNEDEALSVQGHQEASPPVTSGKKMRLKRSSLIERSKAFQEKLNNFMADYSSKGDGSIRAGIGSSNTLDDDPSNRFPTRANDLRHVDQSVNLMDAESARYQYSDEDDDDANYFSYDDDDDDDVYANYTQGFTAPKGRRSSLTNPMQVKGRQAKGRRASRRGSLSMVVENGIDYLVKSTRTATSRTSFVEGPEQSAKTRDPVIELPSGPTKKFQIQPDGTVETLDYGRDSKKGAASFWSRYSPCIRWTLVVLFFLAAASWVVFAIQYHAPAVVTSNESSAAVDKPKPPAANNVATKPPPTAIAAAKFTIPPMDVSTSNVNNDNPTFAKVYHHKQVLEHVLEEALFTEGHDPELDLTSSSAKKALEWMAGYDTKSMELLDAFHYEHNTEMAGNLRIRDDIEDPTNHTNKIVERYVLAVFYFKAHPSVTPETYHL